MHTRAAVVLATTILLAGCASPGKSHPAPNEGPSPIPEHLIRDWLDTNYRGADWTTAGISRIDDSPALTLVATTYPGDADAYRIGGHVLGGARVAPGPWPARRRGVGAVGGGPPHRKVLIR